MDKVFIVVSHFSDSNAHFSESSICFATCTRSSAEKFISVYEKYNPVSHLEIVETNLYE